MLGFVAGSGQPSCFSLAVSVAFFGWIPSLESLCRACRVSRLGGQCWPRGTLTAGALGRGAHRGRVLPAWARASRPPPPEWKPCGDLVSPPRGGRPSMSCGSGIQNVL